MHSSRTIPLLAVLLAHVAGADDDYYQRQQEQDRYRQQQEAQRLQQQQFEQQRLEQQRLQQQALSRQQDQQRFERDNLERQRVERARLDQQRENEVYRRRQERDEDERRDENFNRQKQERDEAFERQEALRRRQTEWTRQVPLVPVAPAQRTCRVITFKTISAADAMNYSSAAEDEVVTYATIAGDFGAGLVGFTIRGNNAGQRVTRFELAPTSKLVDLQYAEGCRHTDGANYTCQRVFKAVRGAVEFEALTAPSAPLGRLVAHVKNTTLVAWDSEQQRPAPGGDCLTLVGFNFDSTFFPQ